MSTRSSLFQPVTVCLVLMALATTACAASAAPAPGWWQTYHTVATDPQQMNVNSVGPMAVRSAGYFGGWYGFWYYENQEYVSTYAQNTWASMGQADAKRIFYFDDGEYGGFVAFLDDQGDMIHNAWTISFWSGTPAIAEAHWFGLESFMADVPWAPFPTAADHGLPAFTYPDGSALPASELYDALARKDLDGNYTLEYAYNGNITNQMAQDSGLDTISFESGGWWNTVRLWSVDVANPQLTDYRVAELRRLIGQLDDPKGVHIDNFGENNLWMPQFTAFGDWSVYRFKEYLSSNFSSAELQSLGITSPQAFDMAQYVKNRGLSYNDPAWATDTLWNIYKVFKAETGLIHAETIYDEAKVRADDLGLDFAVCGNVIPVWPGAALMAGSVDIASFEWLVQGAYPGFSDPGLPPDLRAAYVTRLGARMNTAPYCWPELYVLYNPADPNNNTGYYFGPGHENFHKVMAFDCFANRGILDHAYWYQDKRSVGTDASAAYVNDFIETLPESVSNRTYLADVALVFNPWCDVAESTVAGMQNDVFLDEYSGWADFLSTGHYQWDVLLAEEVAAIELDSFRIIVLPSVTVVDETMRVALETYVANGGHLVVTGQTGIRYGDDQYFASRATPAFDGLASSANVKKTTSKHGRDYRLNGRPTAAFNAMASLLDFSGVTRTITTDAPASVGVNLNVEIAGPVDVHFTLDLNNYDLNRSTDTLTPAPASTVTIQLPTDFVFDPGTPVNYVAANGGAPTQIGTLPTHDASFTPAGDAVTLNLPSFDYYMMVSLGGVRVGLVPVPDVTDMTESGASSALETAGLVPGSVAYAYDNSVPEGSVISQAPGAGTDVLIGSTVNLIVSRGVQMPALRGMGMVLLTALLLAAAAVTQVCRMAPWVAAKGYRLAKDRTDEDKRL